MYYRLLNYLHLSFISKRRLKHLNVVFLYLSAFLRGDVAIFYTPALQYDAMDCTLYIKYDLKASRNSIDLKLVNSSDFVKRQLLFDNASIRIHARTVSGIQIDAGDQVNNKLYFHVVLCQKVSLCYEELLCFCQLILLQVG